MSKDNNLKKKIKLQWTCEQGSCKNINTRLISYNNVIYEDTCDKCLRLTHEPVTKLISKEN